MRRPKQPLFLARAPYRRRRLHDAARLLPVLGTFLLVLPMLWSPGARMTLTSGDVIYFFVIWLLLIAVAAGFAPGLRSGDGAEQPSDGQGDGDDD